MKKLDLMRDFHKEVNELADLLTKSGLLKKDDKEDEQEAAPSGDAPASAASPDAPAEAAADAPAPEGQESPAPEAEGQAPEAEGEMGLEQHVAAMSDEDLDQMLELLMKEMEKRHGQQAQEEQAQAAPEMAQESAMQKSIQSLVAAVEKMSSRLDAMEALNKSQKTAQPAAPTVVVNAAGAPAMSSAEVLNKSQPKAQRLTKSETATFLLAQQRNGDRNISSDDLLHLNTIRTDDQLHQFQDKMTKRGIQFPKL